MTPRRQQAVVTLGPVAAPVARTTGQLISGGFIVEGLELFVTDLTAEQSQWLSLALAGAVCAGQNWLERRRGRKLIGVRG